MWNIERKTVHFDKFFMEFIVIVESYMTHYVEVSIIQSMLKLSLVRSNWYYIFIAIYVDVHNF